MSDTDNTQEPSDTPQEEQVIPQSRTKRSTASCKQQTDKRKYLRNQS